MAGLDLLGLDKEVARAHGALARFRTALRAEPESDRSDPLSPFRHVAGKTAYEEVRAHPVSAHDEPLRRGLLEWIASLTQARVGLDTDVAWARAAAAPRGHVLLPAPREASYREAWRGAVLARDRATRIAWLDVAAELAPALAPIAREASARRVEVNKRLGVDPADPKVHPGAISDVRLREAALELLKRTSELRAWLRREAGEDRDAVTPQARLVCRIEQSLATDAADGWPARLVLRWLDETLPELSRGVSQRPELPKPSGAASFARALFAFGRAMREGGRNALPFAVAKAPSWADPYRFGFVVGALPMQRVFHRVLLGLGDRAASKQARSLARTSLLEAVWVAARWLLTEPGAPRDLWEELTHDLFGGPVDARFAGAWPAARGDERPRLEGLLSSEALATELVSGFDVDWFKNPRAGQWIRARAGGPARLDAEGEANPVLAASSLASRFEEALG